MFDWNIFYTYRMIIHIVCWHLFVFSLTKIPKYRELTCVFNQTVRKLWICTHLQSDCSERSQVTWHWGWVFRNHETLNLSILLTINMENTSMVNCCWQKFKFCENTWNVKNQNFCQHIWHCTTWINNYCLST